MVIGCLNSFSSKNQLNKYFLVKLHLNGYKFEVGVGQVNYFRLFRKFPKIKRVLINVGKGIYFIFIELMGRLGQS